MGFIGESWQLGARLLLFFSILLLLLMSLLLLVLCHPPFDVRAILCLMVWEVAAIFFAPGVLGVSSVVWVLLVALIWIASRAWATLGGFIIICSSKWGPAAWGCYNSVGTSTRPLLLMPGAEA